MNRYMVAGGIRFNDFVFSEPKRLVEWVAPKCAGICAILARDPNWAPKPFQVLCFWEFGNNSDLQRLARMPNTEALFVSALAMPFSTSAQRSEAHNQLVWAYNPVWQTSGGSVVQSELVCKLNELERKHEEQTTQLRLLLASVGRLFEPQPEPRRRTIGFSPLPAEGLENEAYKSRKFAETRA
jgi:hypothetical protein